MLPGNLLRTIAIVLIANSHIDKLYPFPQLGTGGALGNSLFFALSGYGLVLSQKQKKRTFGAWYVRRISRIYPSVFLVLSAALLFGGERIAALSDPRTILGLYIWPTPYWFIAAIVLFYGVYYFLQSLSPRALMFCMVFTAIPYFFFYFTVVDLTRFSIESAGYFKWIFYFQIMLFGGWIANCRIERNKFFPDLANLFAIIVMYFLLKVLISIGYLLAWQFVLHLLTFFFVFLMFRIANSEAIFPFLSKKSVTAVIGTLAGATLEIYLIHGYIYRLDLFNGLSFPFGWLLFWTITLLMSVPLSELMLRLREQLKFAR